MNFSIRLTARANAKLITLKRRTGISHANVLLRWALCTSLADPTRPSTMRIAADDDAANPDEIAFELPYMIFAGTYEAIYRGLLIERCHQDGLETDIGTLREQLHLHILRGIIRLTGDRDLRTLSDLVSRIR